MLQDYFCPYSAQFSYIVTYVTNFDSHVQFADWCAHVKISNSAEYSVLQALKFQEASVRRTLQVGQA
jgi:hypothetical protein